MKPTRVTRPKIRNLEVVEFMLLVKMRTFLMWRDLYR